MNGINAARFSARRRSNVFWMRVDDGDCACSQRHPECFGDRVEVLVTATGEIDQHRFVLRPLGRQLERVGDGVARFERRNDPLGPAEQLEAFERLVVGDRDVARAADVLAARRAPGRRRDSRGRPRSSASRSPGRTRPAGHTSASRAGRRRVRRPAWRRAAPDSSPCPPASTPISSTPSSPANGWKMPIAFEPPPTQAMTASGKPPDLLEHLRARFAADHGLQIADDHRVGMHAGGRAEDVEGGRGRWSPSRGSPR